MDDPFRENYRTKTTYAIPPNEEEMARLDLQHRLWLTLLGGLYPADAEQAVQAALKSRLANDGHPAILDVGSGSGAWSAAMAKCFPDVSVQGIDFKPHKISIDMPNLKFQVGDITKDLGQFQGKIDVLHIRSVILHISDYVSLIKNLANCLRPGGVFLFGDLGEEQRVLEAPGVESVNLKWLKAVGDNFAQNSSYGENIKTLFREEGSLKLGAQTDHWINSNWIDPKDQKGNDIVEIMKIWHPESLKSFSNLLRNIGWTQKDVERAMVESVNELETGYPKFSWKAVSAWAVKE